MRVRVLKPFRDKHTKVVYGMGAVIDVTDERFNEISKNLGKGFVQPLPGESPEPKAANKEKKRGKAGG